MKTDTVSKIEYPPIPPITDPRGRSWEQPDRAKIKFMFGCAWMDQKDFDQLLDYSNSKPTGVYYGKMWKGLVYDRVLITDGPNKGKYKLGNSKWYLYYITEAITKDPEYHTTWPIPIMLNGKQ